MFVILATIKIYVHLLNNNMCMRQGDTLNHITSWIISKCVNERIIAFYVHFYDSCFYR